MGNGNVILYTRMGIMLNNFMLFLHVSYLINVTFTYVDISKHSAEIVSSLSQTIRCRFFRLCKATKIERERERGERGQRG
jgi:ABC-type polar amino acid transport system ATPase subunit